MFWSKQEFRFSVYRVNRMANLLYSQSRRRRIDRCAACAFADQNATARNSWHACCLRSRRNREDVGAWLHSSAERGEIVEQCIVRELRNAASCVGVMRHAGVLAFGSAMWLVCCCSDFVNLSCLRACGISCVWHESFPEPPLILNIPHIFSHKCTSQSSTSPTPAPPSSLHYSP